MASIGAHSEYTEMIDQLAGQSTSDAPFKTMMHLFVACAALGIQKQSKHAPISSGDVGKDVQDRIWKQNPELEKMIYAVAFYDTKDQRIFNDSDKCYEIFQQYVNGGLEELDAIYSENRDSESTYQKLLIEMAHSSLSNLEK
tara:strand:- start:2852 stop:3277 length:426 start_codon:yes stop_codon:yes gene_type:complete